MKKVVKIIGEVTVFLFCGLFILRCCMLSDRSVFSTPTVTDALQSTFADGDGTLLIHTQTTEIANDGYFSAYAMYYEPESGEVQFAVRYNRSVYDYTDTTPGTEFSFLLVNSSTGEEFPCEIIESTDKAFYRYRRLRTTVTSIADDAEITAVMRIGDSYDSRQIVKHAGQVFQEYKIPKKLLTELTGGTHDH